MPAASSNGKLAVVVDVEVYVIALFKGELARHAKALSGLDGVTGSGRGPRGQDCAREEETGCADGPMPSDSLCPFVGGLSGSRPGSWLSWAGRVMLVPSGRMIGIALDLFLALPRPSSTFVSPCGSGGGRSEYRHGGGGRGHKSAGSSPPRSGNRRSAAGSQSWPRYSFHRICASS